MRVANVCVNSIGDNSREIPATLWSYLFQAQTCQEHVHRTSALQQNVTYTHWCTLHQSNDDWRTSKKIRQQSVRSTVVNKE